MKSSEMPVADAAVFMTPGSVWLREDGSKNVLLFITNTSLSKKVQAVYPAQAVYLDEEGNVLNRSVEDFLAKRTFFNVEADVESQVDQLLAYRDLEGTDEDAEDEIASDLADEDSELELSEDADDEDELLIAGGDLSEAGAGESDLDEVEQETLVVLDAPVSLQDFAANLEQAIVGYRQEPILSHSLMAHVLIVDTDRLDATVEQIIAAFDPSSEELIESFNVRGLPKVVWDTFVGAYVQMTEKKYCIAVYLGCSMTLASEDVVSSSSVSADAEMVAIEASLTTEPEATEGVVDVAPLEVVDPAATPLAAAPVVAPEAQPQVTVAVG